MIRSSLKAVVAAFALVVSANSANAAVLTYGVDSGSTLGVNITLQPAAGGSTSTVVINPVAVTGSLTAATSLNGSNTGTVTITDSTLNVANINQNVVLLGFLPVTVTSNNLGFTIVGGPVNVTSGAFTIDQTVPGSLTIDQGTLALGSLYTLDAGASPIGVNFADLGAATIPGSASISAGVAHLGVNYNGYQILTNFDLSGIPLNATITITGHVNASAAVPEVGSVLMVGGALAGVGLVVRRRRSA